MPEKNLHRSHTARELVFDCRGAQRVRIDDVFPLERSAATPFAHTFKLLLAKTPGAFQWQTELKGIPAITLSWNSMFAAAKRLRQSQGATIELVPAIGNKLAMITSTLKDGTKLNGHFVLRDGRVELVIVDTSKR